MTTDDACCEHPAWRHAGPDGRCVDCGCAGNAVRRQSTRFESQAIDAGAWAASLRHAARSWSDAEAKAQAARDALEARLAEAHGLGAPLSQLQGELAAAGVTLSRNAIHRIVRKPRDA